MTLSPSYRASCDAPDCTVVEHVQHRRTADCRGRLAALGWTVIEYRVVRSGAPQLLYACPAHRDWRPADAEQRGAEVQTVGTTAAGYCRRRRAMVWLLHGAGAAYADIAAALGVSSARTAELGQAYERRIARREREAADWIEPWARRLRAAGAIP